MTHDQNSRSEKALQIHQAMMNKVKDEYVLKLKQWSDVDEQYKQIFGKSLFFKDSE